MRDPDMRGHGRGVHTAELLIFSSKAKNNMSTKTIEPGTTTVHIQALVSIQGRLSI